MFIGNIQYMQIYLKYSNLKKKKNQVYYPQKHIKDILIGAQVTTSKFTETINFANDSLFSIYNIV